MPVTIEPSLRDIFRRNRNVTAAAFRGHLAPLR